MAKRGAAEAAGALALNAHHIWMARWMHNCCDTWPGGPHYTGYPTAIQFGPEVKSDSYES
jgi:hypothetical protein